MRRRIARLRAVSAVEGVGRAGRKLQTKRRLRAFPIAVHPRPMLSATATIGAMMDGSGPGFPSFERPRSREQLRRRGRWGCARSGGGRWHAPMSVRRNRRPPFGRGGWLAYARRVFWRWIGLLFQRLGAGDPARVIRLSGQTLRRSICRARRRPGLTDDDLARPVEWSSVRLLVRALSLEHKI